MKKQKQYGLGDAVKNFHKTEPLKIDLAATVADKVLANRKEPSFVLDKVLYVFSMLLIAGALVYVFSFYKYFSSLSTLLVIIPIGGYIGLSVKEYLTLSRKLISF